MPIPFDKIAANALKIGHDQAMIGGTLATLILGSNGTTLETITQGFTVFNKEASIWSEAHIEILISQQFVNNVDNIKIATDITYNNVKYHVKKWSAPTNAGLIWTVRASTETN